MSIGSAYAIRGFSALARNPVRWFMSELVVYLSTTLIVAVLFIAGSAIYLEIRANPEPNIMPEPADQIVPVVPLDKLRIPIEGDLDRFKSGPMVFLDREKVENWLFLRTDEELVLRMSAPGDIDFKDVQGIMGPYDLNTAIESGIFAEYLSTLTSDGLYASELIGAKIFSEASNNIGIISDAHVGEFGQVSVIVETDSAKQIPIPVEVIEWRRKKTGTEVTRGPVYGVLSTDYLELFAAGVAKQ